MQYNQTDSNKCWSQKNRNPPSFGYAKSQCSPRPKPLGNFEHKSFRYRALQLDNPSKYDVRRVFYSCRENPSINRCGPRAKLLFGHGRFWACREKQLSNKKCGIEKCRERALQNAEAVIEDDDGKVIRRMRVPLCQRHFEAYKIDSNIIDPFVKRKLAINHKWWVWGKFSSCVFGGKVLSFVTSKLVRMGDFSRKVHS